MAVDKSKLLIKGDLSIKKAMKKMSEIGQKVLFVADEYDRLIGSLSDGDIRKWILAGGELSEISENICNKKPKVIEEDYKRAEVKHLMLTLLIESVPVVDNNNKVLKILVWEDVFSDRVPKQKVKIDLPVVIMAGGKGTHLDPFTRILPKPLIPIGDKTIIEIIMDKFHEYRINNFFVSVNHKSRMIKSYFEETSNNYQIDYIEEEKPLGTVGGLKYLKGKIKGSFLVTNCDIIVEADCAEIVRFHQERDNDMTLVVSCRHYVIPYGVCEIQNGGILKKINEKPEQNLLVNTGMYLMKEKLINLIPKNKQFDINELIEKAQAKGLKIGVYPISEDAWIDIGQWEEYRKAVEKIKI